ncbi:hypothetical protein IV203_000648 [Nitzschia inconspicua]|uniref:Uncharacterized protein n=1 Tax=Nitzschia inconspicua TaxID=303405 RepID=A0A9K3PQF6_9STRA|nr:hypothetical protein IV203_000648 [Nitzschia inconspicua]
MANVGANNGGGLPFPEMQSPSIPRVEWDGDFVVSVNTKMNYVTKETVEVNVRRDVSGVDTIYEGATWDAVEVPVHNARLSNPPKTLDEHGYQLVEEPVASCDIDFLNTNDVIDRYYPDCEQLLKNVLGENEIDDVKAFDHNVRINTNGFGPELKGGGGSRAQVPLGIVHGDYTSVSAPTRAKDLAQPPKANDVLKRRLGDSSLLDANTLEDVINGKRRFAIINVWRSIDKEHPVEELPLACMDAGSASEEDFRILKIHYLDRVGQNYFMAHSKKHNWNFFPKLTHNEAILLKTWDSSGEYAMTGKNLGTTMATLAVHSAFLDPSSPSERPARQSIEVRCLAIWKER